STGCRECDEAPADDLVARVRVGARAPERREVHRVREGAAAVEFRGSQRPLVGKKAGDIVESDDRVDAACCRNAVAAAREGLELRVESRAQPHEQIELLALWSRFIVARLSLQRL